MKKYATDILVPIKEAYKHKPTYDDELTTLMQKVGNDEGYFFRVNRIHNSVDDFIVENLKRNAFDGIDKDEEKESLSLCFLTSGQDPKDTVESYLTQALLLKPGLLAQAADKQAPESLTQSQYVDLSDLVWGGGLDFFYIENLDDLNISTMERLEQVISTYIYDKHTKVFFIHYPRLLQHEAIVEELERIAKVKNVGIVVLD